GQLTTTTECYSENATRSASQIEDYAQYCSVRCIWYCDTRGSYNERLERGCTARRYSEYRSRAHGHHGLHLVQPGYN
ncbi:hypothetical protein D917_10564, partial [Trichinella nativa]